MAGRSNTNPGNGFTLIELLIVVAIIAILAAIAVPNFLEAQTRSKVTRSMADMRMLKTALETYRIDNNAYVLDWNVFGAADSYVNGIRNEWGSWRMLTTPIAYCTSVPFSPFGIQNDYRTNPFGEQQLYHYGGNNWGGEENQQRSYILYMIAGSGPDNFTEYYNMDRYMNMDAGRGDLDLIYDPTNGTKSRGDLLASNKRIYQ